MSEISLTFGNDSNIVKEKEKDNHRKMLANQVSVTNISESVETVVEGHGEYTEKEMAQIKMVAEKIDLSDTNAIISFGTSAQRKVSEFADGALESVRNKDFGEVGEVLSNLIVETSHIGEEKTGFFGKMFDNEEKRLEEIKIKYKSTETNIDKLVEILEKHQDQLVRDIALLDILYDKNKVYFKEVSMYIEAGKMKLEMSKKNELPALEDKAKETGSPEDAQNARDYADLIDRFEKKLYDLELSRTVCLQTAPEIRMVQNSDTIMSEKIQSTIVNVIPMWKTQMILLINNYHTKEAIKTQNVVTEATNEMLKQNASIMHQNAVDTAEATNRGIVDIETLKNTNEQLISALSEIKQVQENGKIARANAEKELQNLELNLKNKMYDVLASAGKTAAEIEAGTGNAF